MIIDWSMTTPGKRLNQAGTVIFLLSSPITVLFIVSHTVSWINLEPLNLISASLLASRGIVTWAFTLQVISWVHPTLKFWVFLHLWIQLPQVPVFPQSPILNLHIILGHTSLKSCTLTTPHFSPSFSRSLQLPRPCAVRQLWTQKPLEVRAGPPRSVRARALECPIGLGGSVDSREMSERPSADQAGAGQERQGYNGTARSQRPLCRQFLDWPMKGRVVIGGELWQESCDRRAFR